jgi:phosphotriesterase-related protein
MKSISRRVFLFNISGLLLSVHSLAFQKQRKRVVETVNGPIRAEEMGNTLIHEHILVDFIGAKDYNTSRWREDDVVKKVLPYLKDLRDAGCETFIDCTPNYLGRDARLLLQLSKLSGLNIITNTGYYGGSDHKFLPDHVFSETPQRLAERWTDEWENGIDSTAVRPGFIKISVNPASLTEVSKKLIRAAALTHLNTGLTIASHTGPAIAALEQIDLLQQEGVHPGAFIWVHSQNEPDWKHYLTAAKKGAWISLDGLNEKNQNDYAERLSFLKKEKCLERTLLSHDAGWYDPGNPGKTFTSYTVLFRQFLPLLRKQNFSTSDIKQIIQYNPSKAFTISIKKVKSAEN